MKNKDYSIPDIIPLGLSEGRFEVKSQDFRQSEPDKSASEAAEWRTTSDKRARVGYFGARYEVYVVTDDSGKIPHVHIRRTMEKEKVSEVCVRLDIPGYFHHGQSTAVLNASESEAFDAFMNAKPEIGRYDTNYELAVDMWNLNNADSAFSPRLQNGNAVIPDYTLLKQKVQRRT